MVNLTHQDLAKISQDFVAKSIISGRIYMRSLLAIPRIEEKDGILKDESNKEEEEGTEVRAEEREKEKPKPKRKKEESTWREIREQEELKYQEMKNIEVERKEPGGREIADNQHPKRNRYSTLGHKK